MLLDIDGTVIHLLDIGQATGWSSDDKRVQSNVLAIFLRPIRAVLVEHLSMRSVVVPKLLMIVVMQPAVGSQNI